MAAGGSFPVNGSPFAFCDAGVLFELPWAKAKLGAATANAAMTTKDFTIVPPSLPIFRALCGGFAIGLSLLCERIRSPVAIMTSD